MTDIGKPKTIRETNRKIILDLLRHASGDVSIAELSKKVKLSKTTLMKIMNYFVDRGLVINVGKGKSTDEGGKKPMRYRFNESGGFVLAFHIFPHELYSALTDLRISILQSTTIPISEHEGTTGIVNKIEESYGKLVRERKVNEKKLVGIVVGAHGITDYERGIVISSPHFPLWGENFNLKQMICEKLQYKGPLVIDNQIRFQVYAEKVEGLAKNKKNIIVIEGGVGLVAGVIVKDEIKRGVHYLAGEIGHMILNPFTDQKCACGGKGCFEVMVSANRILRMAREKYHDYPDSLIFKEKKPQDIEVGDVFIASNNSDKLACEIMDDVIWWYSIGISNLILSYDPEIIIIQGIFTKAGDYFLTGLRKRINQVSLVKIEKNVQIEYSTFGKDVGIVGSAAYMVSEYFK